MALIKNTVASATYITASPFGSLTANTYAFQTEADVIDGVLKAPVKVTAPGIFTAGTAPEGTIAYTKNESNS